MAGSSFVQTDFRGGFFSPSAQGMMEDPDYKRGMSESFNGYPIEQGSWVRRPPFYHVAYTRFGAPAKNLQVAGNTQSAYNMEVSSGHIRFLNGAALVTDATRVRVSNIDTGKPAILTTEAAVTWATGDQLVIQTTGNSTLALARITHRVILAEVVDSTHIKLHDLLTGKGIDGNGVTWDNSFEAYIARVTDVTTPYVGPAWQAVHRVQTDHNVILLHPGFWPRSLSYTIATDSAFANTSIDRTYFSDGPYLDPVKYSFATPDGTTGIINLTFGFTAWDATVAYAKGAYTTHSSLHWLSTVDQNINNAPADASAFWTRVGAVDFLPKRAWSPTDVGRHIRLLSEPPLWDVGATYADGDKVTVPGAIGSAYWMCLANGTIGGGSNQPGSDPAKWVTYGGASQWTWGKIVSSSGGTPLAGVSNIGNMTSGPGLAALSDGSTDTADTQSARHAGTSAYGGIQISGSAVTGCSVWPSRNPNIAGGSGSAGGLGVPLWNQAYASSAPSAQYYGLTSVAQTGTIVNPAPPGTNGGSAGAYTFAVSKQAGVTINLRAKGSAPASASDGTLLGTSGFIAWNNITGAPIQIPSNDATSTWNYVWAEIIIAPNGRGSNVVCAAEMKFYSAGTGGSGLAVQLLGKPLLYNATINTWRLGRYNDTDPTYPAVGCYHQGRVWFMEGPNHFDASQPIGDDGVISFAPTYEDGTVADNSAISYNFNTPVKSPPNWMLPTDGGIVVGMGGGERLIFSNTTDASITPTNINEELKTSYGSASPEPAITPLTSIFVHTNGRDLHEYMRDAYSGRFVIPPLTEKSKSLTTSGVTQVAYQRALTPMVWAVTNDGSLIGSTYERAYLPFRSESPPKYNGFHHHAHGANRDFVSCSVGPALDGTPVETLCVVTHDRETGFYRQEVAGGLMPEPNDIFDCNYLDGGFIPINLADFALAPANPDIVPPTPPPPPGVFRWVVPGYTLSSQCPPFVPTPPLPADIVSDCVNSGKGDGAVLTPPSTIAFGDCSVPAFTVVGQVPGVDVFMPSNGIAFTIAQYAGAFFGDNKWARYQLWLPNSPSSVPSQPTWTNT